MFNINDNVKIKDSNIKGKIIRMNKNNTCTLLLNNNSKINIKTESLEQIQTNQLESNNSYVNVNYKLNIHNNFDNEIMIRHQTVLEALENVDLFISQAIINKEKRIRIIHGRHGGILRKAVHEYLKSSPYVESFKLADEFEGSVGVTIVYLK